MMRAMERQQSLGRSLSELRIRHRPDLAEAMRQHITPPAWENGPAVASAWPGGWDFWTTGTPSGELEHWAEVDPLAQDPLASETAQPLSLLPVVVEENQALEQPDVYEIGTNASGQRVFMVVQEVAVGDDDFTEEQEEEPEEGLLDHPFLPFGVHR